MTDWVNVDGAGLIDCQMATSLNEIKQLRFNNSILMEIGTVARELKVKRFFIYTSIPFISSSSFAVYSTGESRAEA
jgi:hypothetical protein